MVAYYNREQTLFPRGTSGILTTHKSLDGAFQEYYPNNYSERYYWVLAATGCPQVAKAITAVVWVGYARIEKDSSNVVYVVRLVNNTATIPVFTDTGGTGVALDVNVERIGQAAVWVDANGAVV